MVQIAQQIGVSTATVSLALRDKGRMSSETRAKIKAAAHALDYHAHPVISRACSLARQSKARNYRETIALIIEYPMESSRYYQQALYDGATASATAMGYKLEPFVVSGKRPDQKRLNRILLARGIRGLIVIPRLSDTHPRLYFDWKEFASVEIFRTVWHPANLHHVGTVDYYKILEAMHLLKRVGYKRIGMAIEPRQNYHQRGIFSAAYLMLQSKISPSKRIPPLLSFGPWNEGTFKRWMDRYQPDVLYIHQNPEILSWIKKMKLRVPKDISLFCENVQDSNLSGLRRDYVGMGQSAIEMVSLLLVSNSLGLVKNPRSWLVDELWQAGSSLSHSIAGYVTEKGLVSQAA